MEYKFEGLYWDLSVFKPVKRRSSNVTGWNMSGLFKTYGKAILVNDSMCIWLKNKKMKSMGSTMQLSRYMGKDGYYYNYPMFFSKAYKFKISGFSYAKMVKCSSLVVSRQKW